MKLVAYMRVSTAKQGRSGLGLEAQSRAIEDFAKSRAATVLGSFVEVESGKTNNRPELESAITLARATGAHLVIAKLDRLSRNAAFLLTLRDSGVRFLAADIPDANELTVGIMALIAQQEREAISKRTKEALAAAKRRGVTLGNPRGAAALLRSGKGNAAALHSLKVGADQHASRIRPIVDELKEAGVTSLSRLADALNARGILTPRGGTWYPSSIRNLLSRLDRMRVAA